MKFLRALSVLATRVSALSKISPVRLRAGDVVVVHLKERLRSREGLEELQAMLKRVWPDHKVLIADTCISHLTIVSPDATPNAMAGNRVRQPEPSEPLERLHMGDSRPA